MWKFAWTVAHSLLTLAAVFCCLYLLLRPSAPLPSGRASEHADILLRNFLGVRQIGGDYELPAGERFAVFALLEFHDGRLLEECKYCRVWDASKDGRVISPVLVWGKTPDGLRLCFVDGGSTIYSGEFANLNGPSMNTRGAENCREVEGFRVIGFASTRECRIGHEGDIDTFGIDVTRTIETRKRVVVIGVKPVRDQGVAEQLVRELESGQ